MIMQTVGRLKQRERLKIMVLRYCMSGGENDAAKSKGGNLRPENVQSVERKDHAVSCDGFCGQMSVASPPRSGV